MRLFIRIKNGRAFEHPIFEDNFKQAFPAINPDNLPDGFAEFDRVLPPVIGPYEIYEGVTYEWSGQRMQDVHRVRQMTERERLDTQKAVKDSWAQNGWPSWTFDEELCGFKPPVPHPDNGNAYQWDEATTSWVEFEQP
jgi:hypothetical protein